MERQKKLFYGSSYDRALDHLLRMWPEIKQEVPDATLDVCYGWDLFLVAYTNNPERMAWKSRMDELMKQPGITEHGRVGKKELKKIRESCGIWVYPTHFDEIFCITAAEAQRDGLVPVVINKAALSETVGSGIKVEGDIYLPAVKKEFRERLVALMKNEKIWKEESEKGVAFAKEFDWPIIARKWAENFV